MKATAPELIARLRSAGFLICAGDDDSLAEESDDTAKAQGDGEAVHMPPRSPYQPIAEFGDKLAL